MAGARAFLKRGGDEDRPIPVPGHPGLEVLLRRSGRARRLSLRISQLDGRVTLTLPKGVPVRQATQFVAEKADWIAGHVAQVPVELRPMPGDRLPFAGQEREIVARPRRGVALVDGRLEVPDTRPETTPTRLAVFLKQAARERLTEASERFAAEIGRSPGRITLRDTRSRWGSCTAQGNLMYSWRLIMAPPAVLDYVAAHEVAHLVHMDHSPAFWDQVTRLMPEYRTERAWLRNEGATLHRYRFRD